MYLRPRLACAHCLPGLLGLLVGVAGVAGLGGCGGDGDGTQSVDAAPRFDYLRPPDFAALPPDMSIPLRAPSEHPDGPNVVHGGGPVLKHVDLVTVVWAGDPEAQRRAGFASWVVDSPYMDLMQEYGAGRGTAHGPYFITTAPPAKLDDGAIGNLLRGRIAAGDLPAPTPDVLYMVYLDPSTQSTYYGGRACVDYGGYHSGTSSGRPSPNWMAYAIIPPCRTQADEETSVVTHELVEAVTDPRGSTGWRDREIPYGEVGDLCTSLDITMNTAPPDGGVARQYNVTRFWSVRNALDGTRDPCVPVPEAPYSYFNAAFSPNILALTQDQDGTARATLRIEPFAFGAGFNRIAWRLSAGAPGLNVFPTSGSGQPGSTQEVTVKLNAGAVPGSYTMWLSTTAKGYSNVWYGVLVVN